MQHVNEKVSVKELVQMKVFTDFTDMMYNSIINLKASLVRRYSEYLVTTKNLKCKLMVRLYMYL